MFTFCLPLFYLLDAAYVFQQEFGTWEVIFMKYIFDLDEPAVATVCFDGYLAYSLAILRKVVVILVSIWASIVLAPSRVRTATEAVLSGNV